MISVGNGNGNTNFSKVITLFLKFPIKNKNSQFSAEKDTKVSIWKFMWVLMFYNVKSPLEV